jgi:beta-lactamase class A
MKMTIDRRFFLLAGAALASGCWARPGRDERRAAEGRIAVDFGPELAMLGPGGRLGVAALDVATGRRVGHDENGRYAMCSSFKLPLAAAILAEVEAGRLRLDQEIAFTRADLLGNSPVVEAHLAQGRLPVERLCAAAIEVSDNAAANLLLARIGGPAGLTRFFRSAGDSITRLDRNEPSLNTNLPGDPRDTSSPAAMVGLLRHLLLDDRLSRASRGRLIGWMEGATTGLARLRAGLPAGWRAGDKTGTGNGANVDLAISWPPGKGPILIASFTDGREEDLAARNPIHAAIARKIAAALG